MLKNIERRAFITHHQLEKRNHLFSENLRSLRLAAGYTMEGIAGIIDVSQQAEKLFEDVDPT